MLVIYYPGMFLAPMDGLVSILTIILMIAMYLGLLGLEHGVDPKSAFTSVSMKPLSYRSLLINATQILR
jgi:hypothetical protein